MEENNVIFLAVDYALVYLVIPLHKKYSTTFAWGHSFSMYVHKNIPQHLFGTIHLVCTYLMTDDDPLHSSSCVRT